MVNAVRPRGARTLLSGLVVLAVALSLIGVVAPPAHAATGQQPGTFVALTPARILDTRDGTGVGVAGAVAANGTVNLKIFGAGGIPTSNVSAVVMNVTEVAPTAAGNITVYPSGVSMPTVSNLNFRAGDVRPNLVTVKLGADGYVKLTNSSAGSTHLIADVAGYFVGGVPAVPGAFVAVTPSRILDTRLGSGALVGQSGVVLQVSGLGGVPTTNVAAVVLNVTEVAPTAPGNINVFPFGDTFPRISNLNFVPGDVRANLVTVKVKPTTGQIALWNASAGSVHLVVDVAGYYLGGVATAAGAFVPVYPSRALDTRISPGPLPPNGGISVSTNVGVDLSAGYYMPAAGVGAVMLNVTETAPTQAGNITAYPSGLAKPNVSNLNFGPGETYPNAVSVGSDSSGRIMLANSSAGSTHLIADVAGYYLKNALTGLQGGQTLYPGNGISSPNGQYLLVMQWDGNLALYNANMVAMWSSNTWAGNPEGRAWMQTDGNLVVTTAGGSPLWSTGTANHPGATLQLRDDGHLVIVANGQTIWMV